MYNYHSNYDGDDDDNDNDGNDDDDDDDDDGKDDKELRLPRTEISQAHGIPPPTKAECLQQYKTNIGGYSMVAVHGILPATKMRHGVFRLRPTQSTIYNLLQWTEFFHRPKQSLCSKQCEDSELQIPPSSAAPSLLTHRIAIIVFALLHIALLIAFSTLYQ